MIESVGEEFVKNVMLKLQNRKEALKDNLTKFEDKMKEEEIKTKTIENKIKENTIENDELVNEYENENDNISNEENLYVEEVKQQEENFPIETIEDEEIEINKSKTEYEHENENERKESPIDKMDNESSPHFNNNKEKFDQIFKDEEDIDDSNIIISNTNPSTTNNNHADPIDHVEKSKIINEIKSNFEKNYLNKNVKKTEPEPEEEPEPEAEEISKYNKENELNNDNNFDPKLTFYNKSNNKEEINTETVMTDNHDHDHNTNQVENKVNITTLETETKTPLNKSLLRDRTPKKSSTQQKYTPNPTIIDTELLQKIEITQLEKEKELQLALEEIQAIENGLSIDQRLMHEKWQIRKNVFKEISDIISTSNSKPIKQTEDMEAFKSQILETFFPWLKYFLSETNVIALGESLNTFYIFINYAVDYRPKAMLDFFDELEKIINHSKININETCSKIIHVFLNTKKILNSTINELIKKLYSNNTNNTKLLYFIQKLFLDLLENGQYITEVYIKLILEKTILNYSSSLTNKNLEKKKIYSKLLAEIYKNIEDDWESIKRNVCLTNIKDVEKIINTVKKKSGVVLRKVYNENIDESYLKHSNVDTSRLKESNINTKTATSTDVNDILSIIPDEFYELAYLTHFNKKKEILEKTNKILSNVKNVKDKEKDHRELLSNLNYAIDDSNVLVHSEGIRCLNNIGRLLKNGLNTSKLKLLILSCFDKFKDKKSLIKIELYSLFDSIISNNCMQIDNFVTFTIQFIVNGKNPVIKQSLLEYLKQIFIENNSGQNIEPSAFFNYAKSLTEFMQTESLSNIKDLSTELVMVFKQMAGKSYEEKFAKVVDKLPAYRRSLIGRGVVVNTEQSEKEYKANLKKIKSNLSFSRVNTSTSKERNNRFNYNSNTCANVSTNSRETSLKATLKKRNLSEKKEKISNNLASTGTTGKEAKNNKENKDVNKKAVVAASAANKKQAASSSNLTKVNPSPSSTPANVQKINIENIKKNAEEENYKNYKQEVHEQESSLIQSNRSHGTNISVLEKRMDSAVEHIYNLKNSDLLDYTKRVIKDFLMFVRTVTTNKLDEDMESHFQVILKILFKIWERLTNLQEEILIQTLKVVVVTPCFIDRSQNGLGLIYKKSLIPFLELIREKIGDEKLFYLYLEVMCKFVNFETKTSTFLDDVNPQPTFIVFLDYFFSSGLVSLNYEKLKYESNIIEIIQKSPFLSEYDKIQYLKLLNIENVNENVENNENVEINEIVEQDQENDMYTGNNDQLKSSLIENIKSDRDELIIYGNALTNANANNTDDMSMNITTPNIIINSVNSEWKDKNKETEDKLLKQIQENEKLREKLAALEHAREPTNKGHNLGISIIEDTQNVHEKTTLSINENMKEIREKINQKIQKLNQHIKSIDEKQDSQSYNTFNERNGLITNRKILDDSIANDISILNSHNKNTGNNKIIRSLQDYYSEEDKIIPLDNDNSPLKIEPIYDLNKYNNTNPIKTPNFTVQNEPIFDVKNLILKIPSNLLDYNICEVALYVKLESHFEKSIFKDKLNFIQELKVVLENSHLIKSSMFNSFLQLFEFLLNLLCGEIILNSSIKQESNATMLGLQEVIEKIMQQKDITEIFKVLIYLTRKYLPKDFQYLLDKTSLVHLKTLSYLIKINLDKNKNYEMKCQEILHEINELFVIFPPSNLKDGIPNLDFLDKLYRQLRVLTDKTVQADMPQAKMFVENSKKRSKVVYCTEFMNYLVSIINN